METFVDTNDIKIIVNIDELKNAPRLKGATVFKKIFNIGEENDGFFKKDFPRNKNGEIILLKLYDISSKEWFEFIDFIRNGHSRFELTYSYMYNEKVKNEIKNRFLSNLDFVMTTGIFIKFGPFPEFDKYISSKIKEIERFKILCESRYNPMTPREDYKKLYNWDVRCSQRDNTWSITVRTDEIHHYYYRKLKDN
jgi:hypothetical protein